MSGPLPATLEKLRRLHEAGCECGGRQRCDRCLDLDHHLRNALPLLLDLWEAAEVCDASTGDDGSGLLMFALEALEEGS